MCGICGVVSPNPAHLTPDTIAKMNATLTHRGPDGEGIFTHRDVALAMRRLSIIDLDGSSQPLYNETQRIALVFNGEIFNFKELREQLQHKGHVFRTEGDGETIVHLYEEYGENAPRYLRGQFAFALWDKQHKTLFLGRDSSGEKPLFYTYHNGILLFASEIKAILQHPCAPRDSHLQGEHLAQFLAFGYFSDSHTAFKHIYSLPPAHTATFRDNTLTLRQYWHLPPLAPSNPRAQVSDYLPELDRLLTQAIQRTLIADVPLGAFLSGGLDSSLVVALMKRLNNAPVKTFSIGFEGDDSFDETRYARQVAELLGTEHTEFKVSADAMHLLPTLVWHLDQPFGDTSLIPTYLVSQLTRQHVAVALTGDGGDELFAGYERFYALALVQQLGHVPRPVWGGIHALLSYLPEGTGYYSLVKRARRFARGASVGMTTAYCDWMRLFSDEQLHALISYVPTYASSETIASVNDALRHNFMRYLPDDLLVKSDRATMANSLEGRAPLLDRDLTDYVATIPLNLKLKGATTKHILKQLAVNYLPEAIVNRPKHGFGAPLGAWLRRDMRLVREWLLSARSQQRGLFDPVAVTQLIDQHANGTHDHAQKLWTLLTLEAWHQQYIDAPHVEKPHA